MGLMLSINFSLAEFTTSQTAARNGIDNTLPSGLYANARRTCERLELARRLLTEEGQRRGIKSVPVIVTSGYRCPALNKLVGGVPTSAHQNALAADIIAPAFGDPLEVAHFLSENGLHFDQLIYEFASWVHVGLAAIDDAERGELLQIGVGTGYLPGLP